MGVLSHPVTAAGPIGVLLSFRGTQSVASTDPDTASAIPGQRSVRGRTTEDYLDQSPHHEQTV